MVPEATVVTSAPATLSPVRSMQLPAVTPKPAAGPDPAMEQPSTSISDHVALVVSVVKSSVCGKETISVSVPPGGGLNTPSGSGQPEKVSQVVVKTGTLTVAFADPVAHVSALPLPTVTST